MPTRQSTADFCTFGTIRIQVTTDGPTGGDSSSTTVEIRYDDGCLIHTQLVEGGLKILAKGDGELEQIAEGLAWAGSELRHLANANKVDYAANQPSAHHAERARGGAHALAAETGPGEGS